MDLPPSSELELIQDPEIGLALLAKCPAAETPEQERERQFWQAQFTYLRDWRAGDEMAVADAVICCTFYDRPPPFWLGHASSELAWQRKSDAEKRTYGELAKHSQRWKAVELVRGQCPKVRPDDVWEEAANLVAGTYAEGGAEAVRKSHALVRRAGGAKVTLANYQREVEREMEKRELGRKKNKSR